MISARASIRRIVHMRADIPTRHIAYSIFSGVLIGFVTYAECLIERASRVLHFIVALQQNALTHPSSCFEMTGTALSRSCDGGEFPATNELQDVLI